MGVSCWSDPIMFRLGPALLCQCVLDKSVLSFTSRGHKSLSEEKHNSTLKREEKVFSTIMARVLTPIILRPTKMTGNGRPGFLHDGFWNWEIGQKLAGSFDHAQEDLDFVSCPTAIWNALRCFFSPYDGSLDYYCPRSEFPFGTLVSWAHICIINS